MRIGRKCLRFRWSEIQADLERCKVLSVGAAKQKKEKN